MTELETLQRAKMYMEKLANGINPLDDTVIPDGDIVNHVRMSRCFFYVADVLRQVIENGGVASKKKTKKEPFCLPLEQRQGFAFSETPITISEIINRINQLIAKDNMVMLPTSAIGDWLMSIGMLEEVLNRDGKKAKRPTLQGENMGITMESRTGMYGPYSVVVYNLAAQHFIIDNLDAIVALKKALKENQGQPWTPEHEQFLVALYQKGVPVKEIAVTLKRNPGAVRARLEKLNLYKP